MKKILLFTVTDMDGMIKKGNAAYVRHYEAYFDEVYIAYLLGKRREDVRNGNTTLVALGSGKGWIDLLLAPFRLFMFARKIKPESYLSADQFFLWWTSVLIKLFLKAEVVLMPDCLPDVIAQILRQQSMTGLPKHIERVLIGLSFLSAHTVMAANSFGSYPERLSRYKYSENKLVVIRKNVEALPSPEFFAALRERKRNSIKREPKNHISLLHVGRLHKQKMIDDLVRMLAIVTKLRPHKNFILTTLGGGMEKAAVVELTKSLGLDGKVKFIDYIRNESAVDLYLNADIYVSPFTGTSLREAALCGVPVIAYEADWVKGFFKHEENALLVPPRDINIFASEVIRLAEDDDLRARIAGNVERLAWDMWSDEDIKSSLSELFG